MNELLFLVAGVFVLSVMIGINRGFIRIVASLFATLMILVLVMFASPYVGKILMEKTPLEGMVSEKCEDILKTDGVDTASREVQILLIEQSNLPSVFKDLLLANNNTEVYESLEVTAFPDYVSTYFTKLICDIIAFLVTFLVATVGIRTILYVLDIIGHLPIIGGINRLAGGAVGIATGLIVVWIIFIVITVFYNWSISELFLNNIEESQFLQFLYDHNILMDFVTKFRA